MVAPVGAGAAAAAYRAAQSIGTGAEATAAGGSSFGALLEQISKGALDVGHTADSTSAAALAGQGGVTEVVMAVSKAELALQTAVAVRDRVVAAYQDVMRMPI
jgi:flagellar hook-basal body complex protein FliE